MKVKSISECSAWIRQVLQELPDLGLLCLQKHQKVSLWGKGLYIEKIKNLVGNAASGEGCFESLKIIFKHYQ